MAGVEHSNLHVGGKAAKTSLTDREHAICSALGPTPSEQGLIFVGFDFTGTLKDAGVAISMDGRGRCMDNIFIERLWRSLKYEAVYLNELTDGFRAEQVIGEWIDFYNTERPHSALDGRTPAEAYATGDDGGPVDMMDKPVGLPTSPQTQQQLRKSDKQVFGGMIRMRNTP